MRRLRLVPISFAVLTYWMSVCSVRAQSPPMVNVGAGARSCGEWLTLYDNRSPTDVDAMKKLAMLSWVQGYIVGTSQAYATLLAGTKEFTLSELQKKFGTISGWAFDPPDADAVTHWVTKHCRDYPLHFMSTASFSLAAELFTKK